jgi:hypothetical protein
MFTRTGLERFRLANTEFVPALSPRDSTSTCFRVHKSAEAILGAPRLRPLLRFRNVLQLTGDDVGSAALVALVGAPSKLVVASNTDASTEALREFARSRGIEDQLRVYTDVDSGDDTRLDEIVSAEFGAVGAEVVLDEASEDLAAGERTLAAALPLVPPGGSYVIERWAWDHFFLTGFVSALDPAAVDVEREVRAGVDRTIASRDGVLEELLPRLVDAMSNHPDVIAAVTASKHWLAVQRGARAADGFSL